MNELDRNTRLKSASYITYRIKCPICKKKDNFILDEDNAKKKSTNFYKIKNIGEYLLVSFLSPIFLYMIYFAIISFSVEVKEASFLFLLHDFVLKYWWVFLLITGCIMLFFLHSEFFPEKNILLIMATYSRDKKILVCSSWFEICCEGKNSRDLSNNNISLISGDHPIGTIKTSIYCPNCTHEIKNALFPHKHSII